MVVTIQELLAEVLCALKTCFLHYRIECIFLCLTEVSGKFRFDGKRRNRFDFNTGGRENLGLRIETMHSLKVSYRVVYERST